MTHPPYSGPPHPGSGQPYPTPLPSGPVPPGPYGGYPQGYPPPPPPGPSGTKVAVIIVAVVVGLVVLGGGVLAAFALAGGDDKPAASERPNRATSEAAPEEGSSPAQPAGTGVVGDWAGTYTCAQGLTALSLTIEDAPGGNGVLEATFRFAPHQSNPGTESGAFSMRGSYNGGVLELFATQWIDQPAGYETVDLRAEVPSNGTATRIDGTIQDSTSACTSFSVQRA